jgi:hypothetical protein
MGLNLNPPPSPRLPDPGGAVRSPLYGAALKRAASVFQPLSSALSVLFGPDGGSTLQNPHAMLMSDEDQPNPSITGVNQLSYNQPVITQGIEVRNTNEIWFEKAGQYLVTFTLQVSNRSNAVQEFEVWAGFNGTDYPLSNTRFDLPARKSSDVFGHVTRRLPASSR